MRSPHKSEAVPLSHFACDDRCRPPNRFFLSLIFRAFISTASTLPCSPIWNTNSSSPYTPYVGRSTTTQDGHAENGPVSLIERNIERHECCLPSSLLTLVGYIWNVSGVPNKASTMFVPLLIHESIRRPGMPDVVERTSDEFCPWCAVYVPANDSSAS